ncbi:DUF3558 family protein [Amycolatopsis minnesotensis]|uniref:DUF3558 family protein n=1 Tax=Amycolatopsis minnesotensis TaxID=337894 RepID=UPI0031E081FC
MKAVLPSLGSHDPCGLLTPDEAVVLGMVPRGVFVPGSPEQHAPPGCYWDRDDPEAEMHDSVSVDYSTDITMEDYTNSAAPLEQATIGGLAWSRMATFADAGGCTFLHKLSTTSFVSVSSSNFSDPALSCGPVKRVLPMVSARLPGGAPAPPFLPKLPPGRASKLLASVEPCDLLAAAELRQFRLGTGQKTGREERSAENGPGCQWRPLDGNRMKAVSVQLLTDDPAGNRRFDMERKKETFYSGMRSVFLYPAPSGEPADCWAVDAYSDGAEAKLAVTDTENPATACDQVKRVAAAVLPKLAGK